MNELQWTFNLNSTILIGENGHTIVIANEWSFWSRGWVNISFTLDKQLFGLSRMFPLYQKYQLCILLNTLRPRQHGHHFADDTFKRIFLNENVIISIKMSLKFVPKGLINNIPALIRIMGWRRPGDKPLSEPMMVSLPTHISVTPPQWVNTGDKLQFLA